MASVAIVLALNGNASGSDWMHASEAGRRFPARLQATNTGSEAVEVELRVREGSPARIVIADPRLQIAPGATAETVLHAETTSITNDDTVIEAIVGGKVAAEFRLTVVSLWRESYFHNLVLKRPNPSQGGNP